jgi:hypothetical protein
MDIPTAFSVSQSKDTSGTLDSWRLVSHSSTQATISLGEGLGELVLSVVDEGVVVLDFNNEDVDMTDEPGQFLEGVVGKCAEDLETNVVGDLPTALVRVLSTAGT